MADKTHKQGFASMDEDKQRKIASEGGHASGGNFKKDHAKASKAGETGAAHQSTEDKAKGGEHSHRAS